MTKFKIREILATMWEAECCECHVRQHGVIKSQVIYNMKQHLRKHLKKVD